MSVRSLKSGNENYSDRLLEIIKDSLPFDAVDVDINSIYPLEQQGASSNMYTFLLTYTSGGVKHRKEFILRVFKRRVDSRCKAEFLLLKSLNEYHFSVPSIYHFEENSNTIGNPFIIMELVKGKSIGYYLDSSDNFHEHVDKMAEMLVKLHQLDPKAISNFDTLHSQYLARQQKVLNLKFFIDKFGKAPLFYLPSQRQFVRLANRLGEIHLESYPLALLHLDYEPNHILVSDGKLVLIDWGEALIGDPSFDVALAYHKLRLGRDFSSMDIGEYFVKCYEKHMGYLPVNLEVFKSLVALEMAVWAGLSPFTGNKPSDYCRLVDLAIFGNIFGVFSSAIYRKRLRQRMLTHHTPIWSDIDYIQNYAIQYLEKA
jgi:aminoglycoside phosphotransferase (APT) family kinase protein